MLFRSLILRAVVPAAHRRAALLAAAALAGAGAGGAPGRERRRRGNSPGGALRSGLDERDWRCTGSIDRTGRIPAAGILALAGLAGRGSQRPGRSPCAVMTVEPTICPRTDCSGTRPAESVQRRRGCVRGI